MSMNVINISLKLRPVACRRAQPMVVKQPQPVGLFKESHEVVVKFPFIVS